MSEECNHEFVIGHNPHDDNYRCEHCGSKYKESKESCLWDSMPETFPGSGIKMGMLSCPCPKCTPRY